jgi:hypothetical protein
MFLFSFSFTAMKIILPLLLALCVVFSNVQAQCTQELPIDPVSKKIVFTEIIQSPLDQDENYDIALAWLVTLDKPESSPEELKDKAGGRIVWPINMNVDLGANKINRNLYKRYYRCVVTLQFRDDRIKYTVSDFTKCSVPPTSC